MERRNNLQKIQVFYVNKLLRRSFRTIRSVSGFLESIRNSLETQYIRNHAFECLLCLLFFRM